MLLPLPSLHTCRVLYSKDNAARILPYALRLCQSALASVIAPHRASALLQRAVVNRLGRTKLWVDVPVAQDLSDESNTICRFIHSEASSRQAFHGLLSNWSTVEKSIDSQSRCTTTTGIVAPVINNLAVYED